MLLRDADFNGNRCDLRIVGSQIAAVAPWLAAEAGEAVVEARGGAIVPGLHDHHIHLNALAAAAASVDCGPPLDADMLQDRLRRHRRNAPGPSWIRGVGYHASVAGNIDRDWLDACVPDVPVRIQHRSGRLWILNSCALEIVLAGAAYGDPLERECGRPTGRLYDADLWLRSRVRGAPISIAAVSANLARWGVTGVTDASHANGLEELEHFRAEQRSGALLQDLCIMGNESLDFARSEVALAIGPRKFHLHDNDLPDPDRLRHLLQIAHRAGRAAAFHCVTVAELVTALRCIEDAGSAGSDRIEHGAMIPPDTIAWMARLGTAVITQPNFVYERGDTYCREVAREELPWLYRCASLRDSGVPVAFGSDAPYGAANPWMTMQAAVTRRTAQGVLLGDGEQVSPELALAMFTTDPSNPGTRRASLQIGSVATLCLLDRSWDLARNALGDVAVRLTLKSGRPLWEESGLFDPTMAWTRGLAN